jgi:hypothetical protein
MDAKNASVATFLEQVDDLLERGLLTPNEVNERTVQLAVQDIAARSRGEDADELARIRRAMLLAPGTRDGPGICAALLRGEAVPADKLDREWLARFGRRSP